MNPLMGGKMGNIMQIVNQVSQLRQNPNGIADFLKKQGCVTDEQYSAIQNMGADPMQIGQYLMQTGSITQQQAMQAQAIAPRIQGQL